MAEEILVKEALTDEMRTDRTALTQALDEAGGPVVASFWYYESDYNRWKLMLGSPRVSSDGAREAYLAVIRAVDAIGQSRMNLNHITAIAPDHPLEDAYLYRMTPESAAA
jgi:hypothetical protein